MNIKKMRIMLILAISMFMITGCGSSSTNIEETMPIESTQDAENKEVNTNLDPQKGIEPTATAEPIINTPIEWVDNTKDLYTGAFLNVFEMQSPEGLIAGGSYAKTGNGKGFVFRNYCFEEYDKNKEYISIGKEDGSFTELELVPEDYGLRGAVFEAGPVAGRDEFVLYIYYGTLTEYETGIAVINHKGECVKSLLPDMPEIPSKIIMDSEGYIYYSKNTGDGTYYYVLNPEGKQIIEKKCTNYYNLSFLGLPNGEVILQASDLNKDLAYQLIKLDLETGEEQIIIDFEEFKKDNPNLNILFVTCKDEENIYYATSDGIYRYLEGETPERLYLFSNHGIRPVSICGMEIGENDEIGILYETNDSTEFLFLKPTEEQREIVEIPFVMSQVSKLQYSEAIVDFNKKYPQYLITEVVYEDETQLLTELIAGKGPVLVDTQYVDFAENVKLWECLDEELAEAGEENVLIDKIEEFCQIDGKQYGVVTEWGISTFAGLTGGLTEWNQEQFGEYLKKHPEIRRIFAGQSPVFFLELFYFQSMEKCPFWNIETDEIYFETAEFKQLLETAGRLAGELPKEGRSEEIERIRTGEALGEMVYLNGAETLSYYNAILGDEVQYIGFPGKEGSEHYIMASAPITIRNSATEKQKQAAVLFLEHLISYEAQKAAAEEVGALSVRKDVFEESLNNLPEETMWIIDGEDFKFTVDKERVSEQFMSLYEKAVPNPSLPAEVENILEEELQSYFEGQKTAEQVCSVLQKRMQLYLYEH